MKCDSLECCGPTRSDLRLILLNRFLQPPMRVKQTTFGHFEATDLKSNDVKYLTLLQRSTLKLESPMATEYKDMPYDMYCPSLHDQLYSRICKDCELYFATQKSLKIEHIRMSKATNPLKSVTTPLRMQSTGIAARRANEKLRIICHKETGYEDAEWTSGDDETNSQNCDKSGTLPVENILKWITCPWETESDQ